MHTDLAYFVDGPSRNIDTSQLSCMSKCFFTGAWLNTWQYDSVYEVAACFDIMSSFTIPHHRCVRENIIVFSTNVWWFRTGCGCVDMDNDCLFIGYVRNILKHTNFMHDFAHFLKQELSVSKCLMAIWMHVPLLPTMNWRGGLFLANIEYTAFKWYH